MTTSSVASLDILLVDDSPTDVLIAKEALSMSDLTNPVHVVADGDAALDFLYRRGKYVDAPRPALILLDLNLPRRSGHEVLQTIKSDVDLKSIPVIVLTTSHAQSDIAKSYEAHANSYITKPVDFDRLAEVVQAARDYWFQMVTLPTPNDRASRHERP